MKTLKILVFGNSRICREEKKSFFADHDLTFLDTYEDVQKALTSGKNYRGVEKILPGLFKEVGLPPDFKLRSENGDVPDEDKVKYYSVLQKVRKSVTIRPDFDIVLIDISNPELSHMIIQLALEADIKSVEVKDSGWRKIIEQFFRESGKSV
jgi:hypothetical protein